ncbi:Protein EARLY FLOWERING [Trema orientale]|uniref:Protein EARLY FLOWERING n=1 Tax=Trema orientale TaxID=63057 RepID=A0A2P5EKY3_TREOI|nr:Protein EARLY FLOWERING [Trema orientale]
MKRGKDDEKIMGPMFPRLHVNDTEKGGPRAPPRNKMALYEQLSIPSQRFNSGVLPLNPKTTSNMVPSASSSQGIGVERNLVFPLHVPPSTPTHWSENFQAHDSGKTIGNAPATQVEQRKKVGDEDDFTVPVFVQASVGQCHGRETFSSVSSTHTGQPMEQQNTCDNDPKQNNSMAVNFRREVRSERKENMKASFQSGNHSIISATNQSTRENIDAPVKETQASSNLESREHAVSNFSRSGDSEACLHQESRFGARLESAGQHDDLSEPARDIGGRNASQPRSESRCWEDRSRSNEPENDSEYNSNRNRMCTSVRLENVDKGDDVSETSMVDSISGLDISPDDVVGIIGQKHFWKARRAISNQQRVFAVQVFELHRLIKVQRLIAESPNLLVEDGAFIGKSSLKGFPSPAKKLTPKYVVKPVPTIANCKDDSEKPNHKMEYSAENAVGKTSLSSVKSSNHSMNYGPYLGNPQPVAPTTENMGPWCFHQSAGPQWLVPVMSPSEGLVYKPYSGPGMMGAVFGGQGPFGSSPVAGNFANSAYGIPASHHQGIGVFPGTHPAGHLYFPPYGMPVSNPAMSSSAVEQVSQLSEPGLHSQTVQLPGGRVHSKMEQQSFCSLPTKKSGSISQAKKFQASKGSDLQGSTASCPSEGAKGNGISHNADGRDPLPLFPMAPVVPEVASQPHDTDQPTRVIKVVPHNARSATESAARIFRFIQQERKQFDSV